MSNGARESSISFRSTIRARKFEATIGFFLIAAGAFLVAVPQVTKLPTWLSLVVALLGGLAAGLGGAVLSHIAGRESGASEFKGVIAGFARQFGNCAGRINRIAARAQDGKIGLEVLIPLVAQEVQNLLVTVNELQLKASGHYDPAEVVLTAQAIEDTQRELDAVFVADTSHHEPVTDPDVMGSAPGGPVHSAELLALESELNRLQTLLDSQSAVRNRRRQEEVASCPNCGAKVTFQLGEMVGESASPRCDGCGQGFHAHRVAGGAVTTHKRGTDIVAPVRFVVRCPGCNDGINVAVQPGDPPTKTWFCLRCPRKLSVDTNTRAVVDSMPWPAVQCRTIRWNGPRAVVVCPNCGEERQSYLYHEGKSYGQCTDCDLLLEVAGTASNSSDQWQEGDVAVAASQTGSSGGQEEPPVHR